MTVAALVRPPDGGGKDSLTDHLDDFRSNQFATFDNKLAAAST